jgi:hypothetical protein
MDTKIVPYNAIRDKDKPKEDLVTNVWQFLSTEGTGATFELL